MQKFEYFVMDGRVQYDPERSTVFEALGQKEPSKKALKRDWGDMGAFLVRAPVTSEDASGNSQCGDFEVVREIQ
ncbi:hypothetical protein ACQRVR_005186 [Enterobacter cloacae]|nr:MULTISPECIES: hypothetical protein [Enterobacteriaceae]